MHFVLIQAKDVSVKQAYHDNGFTAAAGFERLPTANTANFLDKISCAC